MDAPRILVASTCTLLIHAGRTFSIPVAAMRVALVHDEPKVSLSVPEARCNVKVGKHLSAWKRGTLNASESVS